MAEKSSTPDPDEDATKPFNRPRPGGADEGLDATAPYKPVGEATASYDPVADDDEDATRPIARPDATAVGGAGAAGAAGANDPTEVIDAWTGRAEVRGPVPPADTEQWTDEEAGEPEEPGRRWWLPILLGVLALLVVIAGITAAVLLSGDDEPAPTPTATGSIAASPSAASPSATPSSPAPSSAPPTAATTVVVPETFGDSQATATNKLTALGLVVNVVFQEDPVAQPGTVLATTPPATSVVPAGSEITIIVAKALSSPSPEPSPSPQPNGQSPSPAAS